MQVLVLVQVQVLVLVQVSVRVLVLVLMLCARNDARRLSSLRHLRLVRWLLPGSRVLWLPRNVPRGRPVTP